MLALFFGASAVVGATLILWRTLVADRGASRGASQNLFVGGAPAVDLRQALLARSATDRAVKPTVASLARSARRLTPVGRIAALERRIVIAGGSQRWPLERVLAAKVALGLTGLAMGGLFVLRGPSAFNVLLAGGLVALGFWLPDILLQNRATKRQLAVQRALPDTLDQLTITVEAGLAFDASIARSARTSSGPLTDELRRVLQDTPAGMSRREALRGLADRVDVPELRSFTTAVSQAEQYGVPIAEVLRVQAKEQRTKRSQRAEEQAMKLPVKLLFPTVVFIFPVMFIVLLGPAAIQISGVFS